MVTNDSDRDPLEELAAEFTERCRRGERPSVEEYVSRHPAMSDDIRELFPLIAQVEQAKDSGTGWSGTGSGAAQADGSGGCTPARKRIGDFRIIRELGRGGMGIVYEAEQESLGRRVAIKVMPERYLGSPAHRERFEREARTAARLHHTNIVPIFGVGEQDECPYIVMQYIHGIALDAAFRELAGSKTDWKPVPHGSEAVPEKQVTVPNKKKGTEAGASQPFADGSGFGEAPGTAGYWRHLARLFNRAADALAFAHRHGVLHRDVKPGNLLLDADGTLWMTDFGLAKTVEQEDITQAGDLVGTLRYMSPEQLEGKPEQRSDIYSLGVTLYEMATLRPAYAEVGSSGILRAIMEEPLRPPRQICPAMPGDLETIILTATAREPRHRYASAAAMRDDLMRFVEDRPIQARRVSSAERLWRWSRRNPALAASLALTLVLLLSVASVSSLAYFSVRRANVSESKHRERAESTANLAVEALNSIFDEFAPDSSLRAEQLDVSGSDEYSLSVSVPAVLSPETARFLEHMLEFYERLAEQGGDSPALRRQMAAARFRVGETNERLGELDAAATAYAAAVEQYRVLVAESPGDEALRLGLARACNQMGRVWFSQDRLQEAQTQFAEVRDLLEEMAEDDAGGDAVKFELARTYFLMGRPPGADMPLRDEMRRSPDGPPRGGLGEGAGFPRDGPPDGPPPGPRADRRPPPGAGDDFDERPGPPRGDRPGQPRLRDPGECDAYLGRAIEILSGLAQTHARVPEYRFLLAQCLRERVLLVIEPEPRRRGEYWNEAVDILKALVEDYPQMPQYRFELARTYASPGRGPDAPDHLGTAATLMEALTRERPNVPDYPFSLAHVCQRMAHAHMDEGNPEAAITSLRRAVTLQDSLARRFPKVAAHALAAAFYEMDLGRLLVGRGQLNDGRDLLQTAIGRLEPQANAEQPPPHVARLYAMCCRHVSRANHELGDHEQAREMRERADAILPPIMPLSRPPLE